MKKKVISIVSIIILVITIINKPALGMSSNAVKSLKEIVAKTIYCNGLCNQIQIQRDKRICPNCKRKTGHNDIE